MAVLTNGNTASAAELFTQALRDYEAAKSIGDTTYGKGTMQVYHKLKDGSAIKVTTNKYNPPMSENYDGVGIVPDYEINGRSEILDIDVIAPDVDNQLAAAVEYVTTGSVDVEAHRLDMTVEEEVPAEEVTDEEAADEETSEEESTEEESEEE
jgi:carboxyl-terminal processing protease